MTLQTSTRTATHAPTTTPSPNQKAARSGLLRPPGVEQLTQSELYREFLRWPMFLFLPASVAVLVVIGMQSLVAAAVCAPLLATIATVAATRRACARMIARSVKTTVTELIPQPRSADPQ
jgi:hypothetical protein